MTKWGLGIEHEMRLRFTNKISELPEILIKKLFPNIKDDYIFIDSFTILYYFKLYEPLIMKNFEEYITTDDEKEYYRKIMIKNDIIHRAKNKLPFPIDNKYFFDLFSSNEIAMESIELLNFYISMYSLYNSELLFFNFNFNDEEHINFKKIMDIDNILNLINTDIKRDKIIDIIENLLHNLYNNNYFNIFLNNLKENLNNKKINNIVIDYSNNDINILLIYGKKTNFTFRDIITKIEKYIINIKQIIDNDNFTIKSIENYNIYKNLFLLYYNNIPVIDYSSSTSVIEFKTVYYENLNYEVTLNNLIKLEETFFYIINILPVFSDLTDIFGNIVYHNIGSVKNTIVIYDIYNIIYDFINEDYTGSFHIWITSPYTNDMRMDEFSIIHTNIANKLQLLEPILNAHYSSPSYNVVFNNKNSKSSLRQFINKSSNYGTTDITLLNGCKKHIINEYFLSENDILNNNFKIYNKGNTKHNLYDSKGNIIINYNSLITRNITNNIYKLFNVGNEESNEIFLKNYFSIIFENTKIRPKDKINSKYILNLGADIRTRNMNDYYYPLHKDYTRKILLKENKLHEVYYNIKTNKISYNRIYDKKEYNDLLSNRIGIEFRIFDHFPTKYLDQFLSILVPIVLDSEKNKKKILKLKNCHIAKQYWHNEMAEAIINGYNYNPGIQYIRALEKEFNINITNKKLLNTEKIMLLLNNLLNKKYINSPKDSIYNMIKFNSKIEFINFNKIAWNEIINKYFENNPDKLKNILIHNKSNKNILEILEKPNDYNIKKLRNYLEKYKL